jgi:subtilisin family serine protease
MLKRLAALAAAVVLVVLPATAGAARPHQAQVRLMVEFAHGSTGHAQDDALRGADATVKRAIPRLHVVSVTVPKNAVAKAIARLEGSEAVVSVQRDVRFKPQESIPDDPFFPSGSSALAGGAWGWTQTHTTQAWDVTRGDSGVVVAVLDTGLRQLPDFNGQTVPGWNVLKSTSDTSSNSGAHGTYVAGVVGLGADNGAGNAGYCPGCKVMPVQIGTDSGAYLSDMASGIIWAADHGARVENLSWAGSSTSSALTSAVAYARSKGVVVVAAAGNSNCNCPTYPASTPGVMGVAGTNNVGDKEGDSNYGSWVTIAAPESNMTAWPALNGAPGYGPVGGTSLASPVVAGIAGLAFSANPALSGTDVENALESSATPVSFSVKYGRVDAMATLSALGFSDPQTSSLPVSTERPQIFVAGSTSYDTSSLSGAPQIGDVLVRGQGSWTGSSPLSISTVKWQRCDVSGLVCTTVASTTKYTVQTADAGSTLVLSVTVKNGLGSTTAASVASSPVGGSPPPPVVSPPANTSLPAISGTPQDGQTLSASSGTWSGSPTSFTYQWQRCGSTGTACGDVSGASSATYALTPSDVGLTVRVVVTATNSGGSTSAASLLTVPVVAAPVSPPPSTTVTTVFSGSLNSKNPSRTFTLPMGAGLSDAKLSFSRCSNLSLGLGGPGMSSTAPVTGPSVLVLDSTVAGGTYGYTISGGKCSFTLTVTSAAP